MKKLIILSALLASMSATAESTNTISKEQMFDIISICNERDAEFAGMSFNNTYHYVACTNGEVYKFTKFENLHKGLTKVK